MSQKLNYRQIFIPPQKIPYANIFRDVTSEPLQTFLLKMSNDVNHNEGLQMKIKHFNSSKN